MKLAMNILSSSTYCNQATDNKIFQNYAIDDIGLCKKITEFNAAALVRELLNNADNCNDLLMLSEILRNTSNASYPLKQNIHSQENSVSAMNPLRIVCVGDREKPASTKPKEIDHLEIPKVSSLTLTNKNSSMKQFPSCKRKISTNEDDETDSSVDYKLMESKRFKSSLSDAVVVKLRGFEEMTESELWRLAQKYPDLSEYTLVAVALGIDRADIQIIESKYLSRDGLRECFYQCLLTWRLNQPENCTLENFLKVLITLNKTSEFINNLKQQFESNIVSPKNKNTLSMYLNDDQVLDCKVVDLKVEESHLWEASNFMAPQWKSIGRSLGLNEIDLDSIEAKYLYTDGMRECCYQTLLLWSQVFYARANLEYLCLCLIHMKCNLYAKKLIQIML